MIKITVGHPSYSHLNDRSDLIIRFEAFIRSLPTLFLFLRFVYRSWVNFSIKILQYSDSNIVKRKRNSIRTYKKFYLWFWEKKKGVESEEKGPEAMSNIICRTESDSLNTQQWYKRNKAEEDMATKAVILVGGPGKVFFMLFRDPRTRTDHTRTQQKSWTGPGPK